LAGAGAGVGLGAVFWAGGVGFGVTCAGGGVGFGVTGAGGGVGAGGAGGAWPFTACAKRWASRLPPPVHASRSFACSCRRSSIPGWVEKKLFAPASLGPLAFSAARNSRSPAGS
jgi:hypothetical protein